MCINIEVKINKHLSKVKLNNLPHRNPFMMRMTGKREGCGELGGTVLFFGISDAQMYDLYRSIYVTTRCKEIAIIWNWLEFVLRAGKA
jgi:hypothetical protein